MKIYLFFVVFLSFTVYSFGLSSLGDDGIEWSTMSGSGIRNVQLSSVVQEISRLCNQYAYWWFDYETPYLSRGEYRARISTQNDLKRDNIYYNDTILKLSWLDSNRNFVTAQSLRIRSLGIDGITVIIVNGDRVYHLTFQHHSTASSFNVRDNLRYIEEILNLSLNGMVTTPITLQNANQTSSSGNSSGASNYNPANSSYLMVGYNYAYRAPFGITIADSMFFERSLMYISANFGYSSEPGRLEIEWIYGVAISITDWLRIPLGIGGNHVGRDGEKITGSSTINGHTTYYTDKDPLSEWEHAFVIEAGLHTTIVERFYLTATYRLKGFSNSGFSLGAGFVF